MTTLIRPRNFAPATDRPVVSPRFAPGLSTTHGGVPTGDTDVSPDPTFPGWLPQFARSSHVIWMSPSALGARADGHTLQLHPPPPPDHAPDTTKATSTTRSAEALRGTPSNAPDWPTRADRYVPPATGRLDSPVGTVPGHAAAGTAPSATRRRTTPGSRRWRTANVHRPRPDPGHDPLPARFPHPRLAGRTLWDQRNHHHPGDPGHPPLLEKHGCIIGPSTARFTIPADVVAYLDEYAIKPPTESKPAR